MSNTAKQILDKIKSIPNNLNTILNDKSNIGHRHNKNEIDGLSIDAANIPIGDTANNFTSENVEGALAEVITKAKENTTSIQSAQDNIQTLQTQMGTNVETLSTHITAIREVL